MQSGGRLVIFVEWTSIHAIWCPSPEGGNMKAIGLLLLALLAASCRETPSQPFPPQPRLGQIIAYVYWDNRGLAGKQIVLVQTGETLFTDANGLAKFSVPAGHYVVRAFEINRGGPAYRTIDIAVDAKAGIITKVDIFDCLACL